MIPLVIHSNTEYLDVLDITMSFLQDYPNKILLINEGYLGEKYEDNFKKIIRYESSQPYSNRLLLLEEIKDDTIIFLNDCDVVIKYDIDKLKVLIDYIGKNDIDKIELQDSLYYAHKIQKRKYNEHNKSIELYDGTSIYKIDNPDFFIFNVNPTIWKLKSLMEIMEKFKNVDYRNIENSNIQKFVSEKYKAYSLETDDKVCCGFFNCVSFFQFIHVTNHKMVVDFSESDLLDNSIKDIYKEKIYNVLKKSKMKWKKI